jgi:hypothetical protein
VSITHPFHPLRGQTFDVVSRSPHWGEERVIYRAADGTLPTIAVSMTDMAPLDRFRDIAAGRAAFRVVDLQRLIIVLDRLASITEGEDV